MFAAHALRKSQSAVAGLLQSAPTPSSLHISQPQLSADRVACFSQAGCVLQSKIEWLQEMPRRDPAERTSIRHRLRGSCNFPLQLARLSSA